MKQVTQKLGLLLLITFQAFFLVACGSSASEPDQEIIQRTALEATAISPERYETIDFKVTDEIIKEINDETIYLYKAEFKIKDKKTGKELWPANMGMGTEGVFSALFGVVKRGEKWQAYTN